ncbi:TPA: hypothetical protein PIT84_004170 [Klebsiella quasipneumoniae subsp. similipneumoniae]|uniref:hypothetical protein n=1 Tax=Klebsiella sp. RC2 TaxID=2587038 RepID=UPI0016093824|nr:hypothetical protein [Klebsiella sp. RC2]MBB3333914.1 hypothetical protein [Klebsiella sp. RC2]HDH1416598.1 hypothetical protein [Klebsiella quasipneumoniae subsp. similipneumoniae]
MNAETIKDFLVSLGFKVDESGERKFNAVLTGVTSNAIKTGFAVEAAALSVVAFTAKIAQASDKLYWASQRTGATVQGLKQVSYAISQVGGSTDSAMSSLESLSRFIRTNPGAEGFLNRLGVQTRDASGNMRDMASIFIGVGQKLSSMPYYRANQYASMLGIDENTLMAMRRGVGGFSGEYSAMAKAIGFNADQAAVSSNRFMTSLRSFGEMAGMARDKIGANLAGGLAGSLDKLRRQILDNFPKIEQTLMAAIKGVLWLGDLIARLFSRLMEETSDLLDWWKSLDKQTRDLITLFGALMVALRILNSTFWMSPIGLVTAFAASIALLWEDYKTWKEGGKSLIDWGKWKPEVDAALKMVKDLRQTVVDLGKALAKLLNIDPKSWSLKWDFSNFISQMGEFSKMLSMIGDLLSAIKDGRWSDAASIGKQLLRQGNNNPDALPGVSDSANGAADWIKDKFGFDPRSVGRFFRGEGNTLADRNNNPGNIRPVGGNGFRSFGSALEGWQAMKNQLMRYFTGKTTGRMLQTVQDIVSTWAPAGDNNDPQLYAKQVAGWMGVSPDTVLNLNNPNTMTSLMQSMARKEGYANWQSPLAYQAAGTSIQQNNTYNIHGGNAMEVAQEVGRRQIDANARVMRKNQSGVG